MSKLSGCQDDALFLQRMVHSMEQDVTAACMKIAQETSLVCAEICTSRLRDVHKQMLLALEEERQRSKGLVEKMSPEPEKKLFELADSESEEEDAGTSANPSNQHGDIEEPFEESATETLPQSWDLYAQFKGSFYGQLALRKGISGKTEDQSQHTLPSSMATSTSVSDKCNEQDEIDCKASCHIGNDITPPNADASPLHESSHLYASPDQGRQSPDVDVPTSKDVQVATEEKRTPEPKAANLHRSTPEPNDANSSCSWITHRRQPSPSLNRSGLKVAVSGTREKLIGLSSELMESVTGHDCVQLSPSRSDGTVVDCSAFDSDSESADFRSCRGDGQSDLELDLPASAVDNQSRYAREDSVEIYRRRITRKQIVQEEACSLRFVGFEPDGSVLQSFTQHGGRHVSRHMHPAWQTFLPGAGIQE